MDDASSQGVLQFEGQSDVNAVGRDPLSLDASCNMEDILQPRSSALVDA
jgi:hypothetical protein